MSSSVLFLSYIFTLCFNHRPYHLITTVLYYIYYPTQERSCTNRISSQRFQKIRRLSNTGADSPGGPRVAPPSVPRPRNTNKRKLAKDEGSGSSSQDDDEELLGLPTKVPRVGVKSETLESEQKVVPEKQAAPVFKIEKNGVANDPIDLDNEEYVL